MSPHREASTLGINTYKTYLTGNMGGGIKWFSTNHFGVRGDYRFFIVRNNDTAPLFFGNETRYGHRVQGGLIFRARTLVGRLEPAHTSQLRPPCRAAATSRTCRSPSVLTALTAAIRMRMIPGERNDQYVRNFDRALGSVAMARVSVEKIEWPPSIGSARSVQMIFT